MPVQIINLTPYTSNSMQSYYTTEIKSMLYAHGDTRTPTKTYVQLIEKIVHTNINHLLTLAYSIKTLRNSKHLSVEDVCFVLRKSKHILKRVLASMSYKELRKKINEDMEELEIIEEEIKYDWIVEKDNESNEQDSDCEYLMRLRRIDEITSKMSIQEYLEFTECRQASFTYRKHKKFKEFMGINEKIKDDIVDVLGVVCYEMVGNIVEEGLKLKKYRNTASHVESGLFACHDDSTGLNENEVREACRRIIRRKGALYL